MATTRRKGTAGVAGRGGEQDASPQTWPQAVVGAAFGLSFILSSWRWRLAGPHAGRCNGRVRSVSGWVGAAWWARWLRPLVHGHATQRALSMQSSIQSAPTPQRRAQPCIHLHTSIMSLSTGTGWRGGVCGLLLLLLELVVPHLARGQSSTVAVSNATSFVAALGGSGVDTILLDQATARVA